MHPDRVSWGKWVVFQVHGAEKDIYVVLKKEVIGVTRWVDLLQYSRNGVLTMVLYTNTGDLSLGDLWISGFHTLLLP